MTRALRGLAWLLLLVSGCAPAPEPVPAPEPTRPPEPSSEGNGREDVLGPFLSGYWELPVPLQGDPPAGFSSVEASLSPEVCRACHPKQFAEWETSLHAKAYSPGFAGQLVEGSLAKPRSLRSCQKCHTPLEEQQPVRADGTASPEYDAALRSQGIVCAGCHVRAHARFGPPRRPGVPAPAGPVAHAGFEARHEFQQARFCATCHQFFDREGPSGKPVENTFVEWRESRHAAEGRTCQDCHMPDRAHTWRGIHDPEMVRGGVGVELSGPSLGGGDIEARLVLTNREVGHAFPSYVTPRVFLALWQADASGREIEGTRREQVIGRQVDFRKREDVSDTRVLPGESSVLEYAEARASGAATLRGEVRVDPAFHYRGVFRRLLERYEDPHALELIEEAARLADEVDYVLESFSRSLPAAGRGGTPAT